MTRKHLEWLLLDIRPSIFAAFHVYHGQSGNFTFSVDVFEEHDKQFLDKLVLEHPQLHGGLTPSDASTVVKTIINDILQHMVELFVEAGLERRRPRLPDMAREFINVTRELYTWTIAMFLSLTNTETPDLKRLVKGLKDSSAREGLIKAAEDNADPSNKRSHDEKFIHFINTIVEYVLNEWVTLHQNGELI